MTNADDTTTEQATAVPVAPATNSARRRARVDTIVWGAILVGVAAFAILILAGGPLTSTAVLWSVVGFGALLLVAALVAAIVRAARSGGTGEHPPIG